ncbi:DUF6958 family protein [Taklimakanibacter deserti]|jgi:hypothetical protein|uniref:DUF6958 family protein n=1 Tax=Taklimakanibacter deserti TaxID=2267839 RepID=UPI000E659374
MSRDSSERVTLENINHPGKSHSADARLYEAMKRAVLKVLPKKAPGLTVAELEDRVLPHLPQTLFPGGAKAGWWTKAVQLDLEAKGIITRTKTSPLRLHKN